MNLLQIAGYLGDDPEERYTPSGKKVVSLRVAARIRHNGRDDTLWWRVSVWGDRYDKMIPHLKKGSSVIVLGEMGKPEVYVSKEGEKRVSLTMTADILRFSPFGGRSEGAGGRGESTTRSSQHETEMAAPPSSQEQYAAFGMATEEPAFAGDELPF